MTSWLDKLSDETYRTALGHRFEAVTDEAFNVLRWTVVVGFARFLALEASSIWFDVIHWATSAMLFGYLASRFLMRPELPLFAQLDRRWKRLTQTVVNYALCMLAFMLVMWVLNQLVEGIARYRFAPIAG